MSAMTPFPGAGATTMPAMPAAPNLRALAHAIEALLGPSRFVDLTVPRCALLGAAERVLIGLAGTSASPADERAFLASFRQAGGALPLFGAATALDTLWQALGRFAPGPTIVHVGAPAGIADVAAAADRLGASVLVDLTAPIVHAREADWLARRVLIGLAPEGTQQPTHLLALSPHDAAACDGLLLGKPERAGRPGRGPAPHLACRALLHVPAAAADQRTMRFSAADLVHDGGYRSEGSDEYSWLWTGPSRHTRILVGPVPAGALMTIAIAKTEDQRNLDGLRVLVDGRPVAHELQRWSPTNGLVSVRMAGHAGRMAVVSLACPYVVPVGDDGRKLGVCLSGLEVLP